MSCIIDINTTCAICGTKSEQQLVASSFQYDLPDLDTRPGEMSRSTMHLWIEKCPHCGYISTNLSEEPILKKEVVRSIIESDEYKNCLNVDFPSETAKDFYRCAYIQKETLERLPKIKRLFKKRHISEDCFWRLMWCAWECDDYGEEYSELAKKVRLLSVQYLRASLSWWLDEDEDYISKILTLVDIYRRTDQFNWVVNYLTNEKLSVIDKLPRTMHKKVAQFQLEKAKEKDNGCYSLEDIGLEDEDLYEDDDE